MHQSTDILLIEDSPSQALQIQLLLQRIGYTVEIARDGVQGIRQAWTHTPRLVLLDVDLPKLNGFQVLARLRHHHRTIHIPVLMLTNRDRLNDVERALELGASDYLPKQDASTQLCTAVQQLLAIQTPGVV